jgi:D-Tyr-tRNAtyr deacylase
MHALIHQPTGVVVTTMLLPGNQDDREAAKALAMSTGGRVLLGDQGYSEEDTFDWLYEKAQTLRVMPSDEGKEGLSTVSQVRQRVESSFSEPVLISMFVHRAIVNEGESASFSG